MKNKLIILISILIIIIGIILLNKNNMILKISNDSPKMYESKLEMLYEITDSYETYRNYLIKFTDEENGIKKILYPNGLEIYANNKKTIAIDYRVTRYGEYEFVITDGADKQYTKVLNVEPMIVSLIPPLTSNNGANGYVTSFSPIQANTASTDTAYAYYAFDNNTSTYIQYGSENTSGLYVQYNFYKKHYIVEFEANLSTVGKSFTYYLQIYDYDLNSWQTVKTGEVSGGKVTVSDFEYYSDKIRVYTPTYKSWGNNMRIIDVQVKGYGELGG